MVKIVFISYQSTNEERFNPEWNSFCHNLIIHKWSKNCDGSSIHILDRWALLRKIKGNGLGASFGLSAVGWTILLVRSTRRTCAK